MCAFLGNYDWWDDKDHKLDTSLLYSWSNLLLDSKGWGYATYCCNVEVSSRRNYSKYWSSNAWWLIQHDKIWILITGSELKHSFMHQISQVDDIWNFFNNWDVHKIHVICTMECNIMATKKISDATYFTKTKSITRVKCGWWISRDADCMIAVDSVNF